MLTVPDLIVYLREPPGEVDADVVQQLVELTNALVDEVLAPLALPSEPARAQAIRLTAAARAYWNPQGRIGETVGAVSWREETAGRAGVYLTAAERAELASLTAGAPLVQWAGSMPYRR